MQCCPIPAAHTTMTMTPTHPQKNEGPYGGVCRRGMHAALSDCCMVLLRGLLSEGSWCINQLGHGTIQKIAGPLQPPQVRGMHAPRKI